jgi:hypothetical protein
MHLVLTILLTALYWVSVGLAYEILNGTVLEKRGSDDSSQFVCALIWPLILGGFVVWRSRSLIILPYTLGTLVGTKLRRGRTLPEVKVVSDGYVDMDL